MPGQFTDKQIITAAARGIKAGKSSNQIAEELGYSTGTGFRDRYKRLRKADPSLPALPSHREHNARVRVEAEARHETKAEADAKALRGQVTKLEAELREHRKQADKMGLIKSLIHDSTIIPRDPPAWLTEHSTKRSAWHHGTPTLFLSDLHWGERVYPKQVNGVNQFDLDIARDRLKRVVETSMSLLFDVLSKPDYDGIVLALGGDMVSGNIHEELRETNAAPINVVVLDLLDNLIAAVDTLLTKFKRVFIPCVTGNHGRLDKKPRAKNAVYDNFEWTLYQLLARHYADDKRVTVVVSDASDLVYRIHNTRYLLTHGDQFHGGSGISGPLVPWSLGNARKHKRQAAIGQPYDTMIFGHWHSLAWGPGDSFICNGSLNGYDEYAFRSNFGFEPPQQALWVTHPKHGITFRMGVQADARPEPKAAEWVAVQRMAEGKR